MPPLTDTELTQLMRLLARASGLDLSDERLERDLVAYKSQLAAIERFQTVELTLEAEPFRELKR